MALRNGDAQLFCRLVIACHPALLLPRGIHRAAPTTPHIAHARCDPPDLQCSARRTPPCRQSPATPTGITSLTAHPPTDSCRSDVAPELAPASATHVHAVRAAIPQWLARREFRRRRSPDSDPALVPSRVAVPAFHEPVCGAPSHARRTGARAG